RVATRSGGERAAEVRLAATRKAQTDGSQAEAEQGKGARLRNLGCVTAMTANDRDRGYTDSPQIRGAGNTQGPQGSSQERERRSVVIPSVAEGEAGTTPEDLGEVTVRQDTVAAAPRGIPAGAGDGHVTEIEAE